MAGQKGLLEELVSGVSTIGDRRASWLHTLFYWRHETRILQKIGLSIQIEQGGWSEAKD